MTDELYPTPRPRDVVVEFTADLSAFKDTAHWALTRAAVDPEKVAALEAALAAASDRLAEALIAHGFDGAEPAAPPASSRRAGPALAAVAALVVVVIWWRR